MDIEIERQNEHIFAILYTKTKKKKQICFFFICFGKQNQILNCNICSFTVCGFQCINDNQERKHENDLESIENKLHLLELRYWYG